MSRLIGSVFFVFIVELLGVASVPAHAEKEEFGRVNNPIRTLSGASDSPWSNAPASSPTPDPAPAKDDGTRTVPDHAYSGTITGNTIYVADREGFGNKGADIPINDPMIGLPRSPGLSYQLNFFRNEDPEFKESFGGGNAVFKISIQKLVDGKMVSDEIIADWFHDTGDSIFISRIPQQLKWKEDLGARLGAVGVHTDPAVVKSALLRLLRKMSTHVLVFFPHPMDWAEASEPDAEAMNIAEMLDPVPPLEAKDQRVGFYDSFEYNFGFIPGMAVSYGMLIHPHILSSPVTSAATMFIGCFGGFACGRPLKKLLVRKLKPSIVRIYALTLAGAGMTVLGAKVVQFTCSALLK